MHDYNFGDNFLKFQPRAECFNKPNFSTNSNKNHSINHNCQIQKMISVICMAMSIFAGLVFLSCAVGNFRSRDLFAKIQFIKNLGLYGLNLFILSFAINSGETSTLIKSLIAIILNIIAINLLMRLIVELAHKEKIEPDAAKKSLVKKKRRASKSR